MLATLVYQSIFIFLILLGQISLFTRKLCWNTFSQPSQGQSDLAGWNRWMSSLFYPKFYINKGVCTYRSRKKTKTCWTESDWHGIILYLSGAHYLPTNQDLEAQGHQGLVACQSNRAMCTCCMPRVCMVCYKWKKLNAGKFSRKHSYPDPLHAFCERAWMYACVWINIYGLGNINISKTLVIY